MRSQASPVTGGRIWVGAALVAIAVLTAVVSLRSLIAPGTWFAVSVVGVVLLAVLVATLRRTGRSRWAPTVWGVVAAALAVIALYGGQTAGLGVPSPTLETARRMGRLVQSGTEAIANGRIPIEPQRGIELLVVAGALAAYLAVDLVALGLGRAGLSGVFLIALWSPAALFDRMPAFPVMVLGGVTFLLLLTLTRPSTGSGNRAARGDALPALGVAAAITVVALAAGPIASAMPFYGAVHLPGSWGPGGLDGPLRLSTDLDMRSSLATRSDRPLLRYTTDDSDIGPLRMYTMTEFDGTEWQRDPGPTSSFPEVGSDLLWPVNDPVPPEALDVDRMAIRIGGLDSDRLPIPVNPRSVELSGRWLYDQRLDEVVGDGSGTQNLSYSVTIASRDLSVDGLTDDTVGGRYGPAAAPLVVPDTELADEVAAIAAEVTADAEGPYEQALALQMYLRDASRFRYNTEVAPAQTDDAVYDFLVDRNGYCVQFATAMAVMARTLGIPARLGVGFLPGRPNPEVQSEFVVTGRQSHAWPELYFDSAGWVRFEPTPAVQTGAPPRYADPFAGVPVATPTPTATASDRATSEPQATTGTGGQQAPSGRVSIGTSSVPLVLVLGVAVLVAVAVTALVLSLLRRHRRRVSHGDGGPEVAWAELRARLAAAGVVWDDATTVRQAVALVRDRYRSSPHPVGSLDQAEAALAHLASVVEAERYAPTRLDWEADELAAMVEQAARPLDVTEQQTTVSSGSGH